MDEQEGKVFQLADHPRFRKRLPDPELVEIAPGEYLSREDFDAMEIPDQPSEDVHQEYENIDWENEGVLLAICVDCEHKKDSRPKWRQLLGQPPTIGDLRCSLKAEGRCDQLNPDGSCDDWSIEIHYEKS